MLKKIKALQILILCLVLLGMFLLLTRPSSAANFPPQSQTGTIGLQGTISSAPPSQGPTIVTPVNGSSFSSVPVTVDGLCPSSLLIKLFSNNVFVGSVYCSKGSYSIQINLFPGVNDLIARDYDSLGQSGPDSNTVSVTFNDIETAKYGSRVTLTSNYAEEGVNPGSVLTWPIIIAQGTAPYAVEVNWGDGSPSTLLSEKSAGTINITHTYSNSGIYYVVIKATDANGTQAYLQVVAVVGGALQKNTSKTANTIIETKVLWWPAVAMLPLIVAAFWVGRRHELFSLRSKIEKSRDEENK